jgi:class 3 adenylate cyclase/tetratricopeptide (TPR) repeat protein
MTEREQLEQAITALEAQRAILGDAVVNAALAPMREKLAALTAAAAPPPAPRETQQRKQVTVLFADVSGFTAMSETLDPEEVSATMNALWAKLDGAIVGQGGRIDKHIGDAVMALFGTPVAREDDPERAIRAALAMQAEVQGFMVDEKGEPHLRMRIGINTGPVLLGQVGTTGEYTAMGDTVNLASRLEHAAPVGGILISHDTYRHVRGVFTVLPLDPITVKGKAEPIQVYVVQRAKPKAFRVTTRGVEGIETRTIGREAELQKMQAAFLTAREEGRTHLISLVAEAGTGKSRLLYEFNNWLELLPDVTRLFRGRATLEMSRHPYSLIRDVLASRFDIQDSDRASLACEKLEHGIAELAGRDNADAVMWAHFIGHQIGFDFSASPHLQGILGDARQIRDRAFYYAAQFFATVARDNPAVAVLLEDIHWADSDSLDLIQHLLDSQPDLPLLVISLARPTLFEQRPNWGEGTMAHLRLDLQPLSNDDSRRLVAEILRKAPDVPLALVDLIVTRAEGSPFYTEELIKMLIEDGVIVTNEETWRVELERLAEVRVPATLTGILQARLDGLPAPERETLQQAAIVGRVFWGSVVEHMHQPDVPQTVPATATMERFRALSGKELIFRREASAFADTQEYIFKHAILHDVTYESVLKRLRREYHRQVAESLIELSGERAGEYAGRIGEHFEKANDWAPAAEWYGRAGHQARRTYAPEAAINYYQKALMLWNDAGKLSEAHVAQRFEVYSGLGDVLNNRARYTEAIETYHAMRTIAEAAGNQIAQARAWCGLALAQSYQGDQRAALDTATHSEALARAAGAHGELALILFAKGVSLVRLGEAEAALPLGEEMFALANELNDQRQAARSLNLMGGVNYALGRYPQAEQCFTRALTICQELGDRGQSLPLLNNLGAIAEARGDYSAALERFQEAVRLAREIGHRDGELVYLQNVGLERVRLGEYQAAEADMKQVIQMAGTTGSWILAEAYRILAEASLGQGRVEEARTAAQKALTLAQSGGLQEYVGAVWRTLGMVAARLSEPLRVVIKDGEPPRAYDAAACFTESARIYTEAGMEGERAHTLREWARYELRHGEVARGAAMWQEARETFARLGAELEVARMSDLPPAA